MAYEKRIRYIEYWDNGNRIRSVGFVKIEVKNDYCNIQIRVNGVPVAENCLREVKASSMEMEEGIQGIIGKIEFTGGSGCLDLKKVQVDRLCENMSYQQLAEIRIALGKNRELICCWKDVVQELKQELQTTGQPRSELQSAAPVQEAQRTQQPEEQPQPEPQLAEQVQLKARPSEQLWPRMESQPVEQPGPEVQSIPQSQTPGEQQPESQPVQRSESQPEPHSQSLPAVPHSLQEDKWRQLEAIYPHIAPFHDKRDYLTIGPQDFVVLPKQYYQLITNSFLLHGYYNYGHMVLAREMQNGEEKFFVGVPGNFYEKERQAAIMFGFESFECKKEPVQTGDYGYFMIRVEL